jgi:hypothetical protein
MIRALRAQSSMGPGNPGITFFANQANGPALNLGMSAPVGLTNRPGVLRNQAVTVNTGGGGGGTTGGGVRVTLPELLDRGLRRTIGRPGATGEGGVVVPPGDGTGGDGTGGEGTGGDTGSTTIAVTGGGAKTGGLKNDASYWGEGGDQLVAGEGTSNDTFGVLLSDMDDDTLGAVDDVNGADFDSDNYTFGVLQSDQDAPLKNDASYWGSGADDTGLNESLDTFGVLLSDADTDSLGSVNDVNGADLSSDLYSLGVLMDDVDDPGSSDDVNGSDLQSDQYSFGVLESDADPLAEMVDVNALIDELDMFAFAKEAERKLQEKFGDTEYQYQ